MKVITKGDKIVMGVVLIMALAMYFIFSVAVASETAKRVEVHVDGELFAQYSLGEIKSEKVVNIKTKYGENILKLTDSGVEMIDASCPDKLDVRVGKITKVGQIIICLPNRVSVKLVGDGENLVDKVAY